ncbi:MAG TPA: HlyD family efflux transporter periplasmic adaptor subunit [Kofleriaceae bacterium]|nr:HlyD family efflux transporter periplasmic adaptor subunit [Kofleriaceae bacterium]
MPALFSQTTRALHRDSFRGTALSLAGGAVILGAWVAWFFLSETMVVESSRDAQLEAASLPRPIESPIAGRVVVSRLRLGVPVAKGAPLVELDSEELRLQVTEQQARLGALEPQLRAIRGELAAEERGLASAAKAARAARAESHAHRTEAEVALRVARDERARMSAMRRQGVVPEVELMRAGGQVEQRGAVVKSLRVQSSKLQLDARTTTSDRGVRIERLRREEAELVGEADMTRARVARLEHEIEQHVVRAPATGVLSSVVELTAGAMVGAGDQLGSILPDGRIRIVARFAPQQAIGRVRVGQRAWMRLDGFPWTQYGALPARVSAVAGESHEGRLRVELELDGPPPASIPIQHGLPGAVEVEVERASPATLVLRAAGLFLGGSDAGGSDGAGARSGSGASP